MEMQTTLRICEAVAEICSGFRNNNNFPVKFIICV